MKKKQVPTFWGVRVSTWYGIAKWISIAGVGLAAIIGAFATLYKAIYG